MGLSAAAETLVRILKRVIVSPAVYPRFLEIADLARSLCYSWATCCSSLSAKPIFFVSPQSLKLVHTAEADKTRQFFIISCHRKLTLRKLSNDTSWDCVATTAFLVIDRLRGSLAAFKSRLDKTFLYRQISALNICSELMRTIATEVPRHGTL